MPKRYWDSGFLFGLMSQNKIACLVNLQQSIEYIHIICMLIHEGKSDLYQMYNSTSTVICHPEHPFAKHSAIPRRDFQYRIPAGPVYTARKTERDI